MEENRDLERSGTISEKLDLLQALTASLPAELQSKLNELVPQLLNEVEFEGKAAMIYESRYSVYKAVIPRSGRGLLLRFPTSTQLDEDAKSSDPAVAEKAKRLQAFEKLLEDAFYDSPEPGRVIVHYTPKPGDEYGAVDAERITSISILV